MGGGRKVSSGVMFGGVTQLVSMIRFGFASGFHVSGSGISIYLFSSLFSSCLSKPKLDLNIGRLCHIYCGL